LKGGFALSNLGKTLAILAAVLAIAIGVIEAHRFAISKSWEEVALKELENREEAEAQRKNAFDQLLKANSDAKRMAGEYQVKVSSLETEKDRLKKLLEQKDTDLAERDRQVEAIKEDLMALQKEFAELVAEKTRWQQTRDDAIKEADRMRRENADLLARLRISEANRQDLKEDLLTTREKVVELEKQLAAFEEAVGGVIPKSPVAPLPKIEGRVTLVDNKEKTIQINVGLDDGVAKGMEFTVFRKDQYLAMLTVTKVTPNSAAGTLSTIKGKVRRDDSVKNRLKP